MSAPDLVLPPEPPAGEQPMVRMRGVRKAFGDLVVLDGLDLDVAAGEKVVIVGPSGSGKTTILRVLMTLERPDAGTVEIDGQHLYHAPQGDRLKPASEKHIRQVRRDISMVFQHFNLFPHMTARHNVALSPRKTLGLSRADADTRALELLDAVGLGDKADQYPAQLSGGQKQRVAIARALAMQPKVMLFDEVTSALDPELVGEVLAVLREIAEGGATTMLLVTHEMGFAREIGDRLLMFDAGRVIEEGPPAEVFAAPRLERTRAFLNAVTDPAHAGEVHDQPLPPADLVRPDAPVRRRALPAIDPRVADGVEAYLAPQYVRTLTARMVEELRLTRDDRLAVIGPRSATAFAPDILEQVGLLAPVVAVDPTVDRDVPEDRVVAMHEAPRTFVTEPHDLTKVLLKDTLRNDDSVEEVLGGLRGQVPDDGAALVVQRAPVVEHPLFDAARGRALRWNADTDRITDTLEKAGFSVQGSAVEYQRAVQTPVYLRMVRDRYLPMLDTFTDAELRDGIAELERRYRAVDELLLVDRFTYLTATPA